MPSRLFYTTLAFLANLATLPALARDALDLGSVTPFAGVWLNGYRSEAVQVKLKDGSLCTLPITFHPGAGTIPPVVLLHGITDSRNAFYPYIDRLGDEQKPYKQFLAIDWPLNGDSHCEQVQNPADAAEAIHLVLEKFLADKERPAPSRIVGASMGVVMSIYLSSNYPSARLTWITPPVLREAEMTQLVNRLTQAETREDAKSWIAVVRTDPRPLPLPRIAYGDMLKRMKRAAPIMANTNVAEICAKAALIEPSRVDDIFTGQLDKLTPAAAIHPCLDSFKKRTEIPSCSHNIARDCPKTLPLFQ